jgi:hypothetical protein
VTIPTEILELWQQHSTATFPKGYGGKDVNGINLPLLEAEIAGLIRVYITSGKLDPRRELLLRGRLIDLNTIVLLLDNEALIYFSRLNKLANLMLDEVGG